MTGSTTACNSTPGLVAAYAFNDGSGTTLLDASGHGRNGTITGATWTTGRNGGGLSFDGADDHVALGSLGTFYNNAFTLEAWVQKSTAKKDVGVVGSWTGTGPMLWVDHAAGRHYVTLGTSFSSYLDSGVSPAVGQWQHLAATFDGTTARYYVDGAQVATRAVSGSVGSSNTWRIGAYGAAPGGFFDGLVDDVRVYNRALTAGQILFDRDHGVTPPAIPPDTSPPSAPGALIATPGHRPGDAELGCGERQRRRDRSTTFTARRARASRRALRTGSRSPPATTHTDTGLVPGVYYYRVTAQDAEGNVGPASNEASRNRRRHDAAERSGNADRDRRPRACLAVVGRRHRQHRRRAVQRASLDVLGLHAVRGEPCRTTDRPQLLGRRTHGDALLRGHGGGRRRQRRARVEPSERHSSRRTRPVRPSRSPHRPAAQRCRGSRPSAPTPPTTSRWRASSSGSTG